MNLNEKQIGCSRIFCRVDASYDGSISIEITLFTSPYKIFYIDSNGHGCYLKKYY